MRRVAHRFALAAALVVSVAAALAQAPRHRDAELERIRAEVRRLRGRLESVRSRARTAEQELERVDLELAIRTRELALAVEAEQIVAERQQAARSRIEDLAGDIETQKRFLAQRLAALYKLGPLSYLRIALTARTDRNPLEAASMLTYLVERDARLVSEFQSARRHLDQQLAALARQEQQVRSAHQMVSERKRAVEQTRREKQNLLVRLRSESSQSQQRLAELEERARRLESLFRVLYERRPADSAGVRIAQFKGVLEWPFAGAVLERFGRHRSKRFATFTINNGIKIAAAPRSEVRTIFDGTVLFSQWFKGYGNLVIVDHGDRVFSLYGNLRNASVGVGDRVRGRQVVGTAGEGEDEAGFLYFEIRENNRPTDPLEWLR